MSQNTPPNGDGPSTRLLCWLISTLTALALGISGSTVVTHTSMLAQHAERLAKKGGKRTQFVSG